MGLLSILAVMVIRGMNGPRASKKQISNNRREWYCGGVIERI